MGTLRTLVLCTITLLSVACASHTPQDSAAGNTTDEAQYNQDSWRSMIPESCAHFFDGCNKCSREPGADVAACTRMACVKYQKPQCLDDQLEAGAKRYRCEGGHQFAIFRDEYRADDQRMKLKKGEIMFVDAQTHTATLLKRVPTGSGERYDSGDISFFSKGPDAMLLQKNAPLYRNCSPI